MTKLLLFILALVFLLIGSVIFGLVRYVRGGSLLPPREHGDPATLRDISEQRRKR